MNYESYIKQKYMKMALKGVKVPFSERWEAALVAAQCIFAINANMQTQAAKLIDNIDDAFNDSFSNGKPIELTGDAVKYLTLILRVQNYLIENRNYITKTLPQIDMLVVREKDRIDEGVYKYYVGNKGVLSGYSDELGNTINAISNSLSSSFIESQEKVNELRTSLSETFNKTKVDLISLTAKFSAALSLDDTLKFMG